MPEKQRAQAPEVKSEVAARRKVRAEGGSRIVAIPPMIVQELGFDRYDEVTFKVMGKGVLITPAPSSRKRKTLAETMRGGPIPLSDEDRRFLDSTVGREI